MRKSLVAVRIVSIVRWTSLSLRLKKAHIPGIGPVSLHLEEAGIVDNSHYIVTVLEIKHAMTEYNCVTEEYDLVQLLYVQN